MSNAWETIVKDVERILAKNTVLTTNITSISTLARKMHVQLDMSAIEKAALYGDNMDDQIEYADECIEEQLLALGVITINEPKEVR